MFTDGTNTNRYRTYARVGFAGIVLSFALLLTSWKMMYGERVLGTTSDIQTGDAMQQGTPQDPGQTQIGIQQPEQQNPIQGDTPASSQIPTIPTTEVTISNPTTEIVIENTDSELVITDVGTQTEIVSVPSQPILVDSGGVVIPASPQSPTSGDTPQTPSTTLTTTTTRDTIPVVTSTLPGITTTSYVYTSTQNISTSTTSQGTIQNDSFFSSVQSSLARPLSFIGIGAQTGSASTVPPDAVTIQYTPSGQTTNLDAWLKDYQFQV